MTTYTTKLQYSDGRIESVVLPSEYTAGDILAITHLNTGAVIAQRVTPKIVDTLPGEIQISIGTVPRFKAVGIYYMFKYENIDGNPIRIYNSIDWGTYHYSQTFSFTGDSGYQQFNHPYYAGAYSFPQNADCKFVVKVLDLSPGEYVRFDYFTFGRYNYHPGELLPDGSFESGSFGDGVTQWLKNEGGKVRIINTDAYSGSYCCEFYG